MNFITENLTSHLGKTSIEQFRAEWNEIVSEGMYSPRICDYMNYIDVILEYPPLGNYKFLEEKIPTFTAPKSEPFLI